MTLLSVTKGTTFFPVSTRSCGFSKRDLCTKSLIVPGRYVEQKLSTYLDLKTKNHRNFNRPRFRKELATRELVNYFSIVYVHVLQKSLGKFL